MSSLHVNDQHLLIAQASIQKGRSHVCQRLQYQQIYQAAVNSVRLPLGVWVLDCPVRTADMHDMQMRTTFTNAITFLGKLRMMTCCCMSMPLCLRNPATLLTESLRRNRLCSLLLSGSLKASSSIPETRIRVLTPRIQQQVKHDCCSA